MISAIFKRISRIVPLILFLLTGWASAAEYRIVPQPKKIELKESFFKYESASVEAPAFLQNMLREEFEYLGEQIVLGDSSSQDFQVIWGEVDVQPLLAKLKRIENHADAYVLDVSPSGVGVVAANKTGLFHGVQSLLQLMEQSPGKIPVCSVSDWPDLDFRGFHTVLRPANAFLLDTVDEMIPIYEWMIRRLARYKYTSIVLSVKGTLELNSSPVPMGPWTAEHVKHLVAFARDRGIHAFPEIKSAGKVFFGLNDAQLEPVAHLLEPKTYIGQLDYQAQYHDGYKKRAEALEQEQRALADMSNAGLGLSTDFKLDNPEVEDLLLKIIDEMYDIFDQPDYFHLGVDENFYVGISQDAKDRGPLLAKLINRLAAHLKAKGCKVMMFDDMLINHEQFPFFFEAHGGPPLNTWTAVQTLDRDIIMACWHYGYTVAGHYPERYPMVEWLAEQGFEVIAVPWFKQDNILNLTKEVVGLNGLGVMGSAWAIHRSWYAACGGDVPQNVLNRRELGVFSTTAEAFWSPEAAESIMTAYDQEAWEKRWVECEPCTVFDVHKSDKKEDQVKKTKTVAGVVAAMALSTFAEDTIIAGWDNSFNVGRRRQVADYTAQGVAAVATWDGKNPARIDRGSSDLTFGTVPGAVNSVDLKTGSEVLYTTTEIKLLVTNGSESEHSYTLSGLHFDYNRAFPNGPGELLISFSGGIKGQEESVRLKVTGKLLKQSMDFKDVDLSLLELEDAVLAPGEEAVITIKTVGGRDNGGIQIDNIAITGK